MKIKRLDEGYNDELYIQISRDLINLIFQSNFQLHHMDGDLSNNRLDNIAIIPNNFQQSYHNYCDSHNINIDKDSLYDFALNNNFSYCTLDQFIDYSARIIRKSLFNN